MDTIKTTFFENPLYIYIAIAMGELVLAYMWYENRTRKNALRLLIAPVLAIAVFVVSVSVETDREVILRQSAEIAADVQADKSDALKKYLLGNFKGSYRNAEISKNEVLVLVKQEKQAYRISEISLSEPQIDVKGKYASMVVAAMMNVEAKEFGISHRVRVVFRIKWVKVPEGWRMQSAAEPEADVKQ